MKLAGIEEKLELLSKGVERINGAIDSVQIILFCAIAGIVFFVIVRMLRYLGLLS